MTPTDVRDVRTSVRKPWTAAAVGSLLLKLPLVAVALLNPDGIDGRVPSTEPGPGLYLMLAFLGSSIVLLALRLRLGVLSAAVYAAYSLVGGVVLLASFPLWGAAVALTSVAALTSIVLAVRTGELSRTPTPGRPSHD